MACNQKQRGTTGRARPPSGHERKFRMQLYNEASFTQTTCCVVCCNICVADASKLAQILFVRARLQHAMRCAVCVNSLMTSKPEVNANSNA